MQIANPSPSGGRVNILYRRVQCVPPSYVTIYVLNNRGNDAWVELEVEVPHPTPAMAWLAHQLCTLLKQRLSGSSLPCRRVDEMLACVPSMTGAPLVPRRKRRAPAPLPR